MSQGQLELLTMCPGTNHPKKLPLVTWLCIHSLQLVSLFPDFIFFEAAKQMFPIQREMYAFHGNMAFAVGPVFLYPKLNDNLHSTNLIVLE